MRVELREILTLLAGNNSQLIARLSGQGAAALLELGEISRPNGAHTCFSASYAIRPMNFSEL